MKKYLLILVIVVMISSIFMARVYNRFEKAYNRPFVETLIWNLQQPLNGYLSAENKEALVRIMLINYLSSENIQSLKGEYCNRISSILSDEVSDTELDAIIDKIFLNIVNVKQENSYFSSANGECRILIPYGSPKVSRDYSGEECSQFIEHLRKDFKDYLTGVHDMGTDKPSSPE